MPSSWSEAAMLQLEALGFIKFAEDDEGMFLITGKGMERAEKTLRKMPADDQILLILCGAELALRFAEYQGPDEKGGEVNA